MTPSLVNESELDRLERIADDYRTQGYDVKLHPRPGDLPGFLAGFEPDVIAFGKGENIVVEVKRRGDLTDTPNVLALEVALRDQPGWRFELIIDGPPECRQTLSPTQFAPRWKRHRSLNSGSIRLRLCCCCGLRWKVPCVCWQTGKTSKWSRLRPAM